MDSNIIKVKTDGDILRDAVCVTGFEIDGSEYVLYCIDRDDGVNDNFFTSKLVKDASGVYGMANINDSGEKINITNVVKSLVTSAVKDNEHDNLGADTITIDGKNIRIFPVTIPSDKVQTVSNQLSYITTVKKSVTEVTKKYYVSSAVTNTVNEELFTDSAPVVENIPVIDQAAPTAAPVVNPVPVTEPIESVEMPVLEPTPIPETPVETTPVVDVPADLLLQPETPAAPVAPAVTEPVLLTPDPVVPSAPVAPTPEIQPVEYAPTGNNDILVGDTPVTVPEPAPVAAPVTPTPAPEVAPPVVNPVPTPAPAPVVNAGAVNIVNSAEKAEVASDNKLVLDGTHENNLNQALGEISDSIPVENIEAVKEFGVDTPVAAPTAPVITPPVDTPVADTTQGGNKSSGFANSKFFMFIALAFFFASCVFLGYEVFNYFQIVK